MIMNLLFMIVVSCYRVELVDQRALDRHESNQVALKNDLIYCTNDECDNPFTMYQLPIALTSAN